MVLGHRSAAVPGSSAGRAQPTCWVWEGVQHGAHTAAAAVPHRGHSWGTVWVGESWEGAASPGPAEKGEQWLVHSRAELNAPQP